MKRKVSQILETIADPVLGVPLARTSKCAFDSASAKAVIELGYPLPQDERAKLALEASAALAGRGVEVEVEVGVRVTAHAVRAGIARREGVSNVIAVASGKGGVGKSTVAVNLAASLAASGAAVGLLDADLYGPSAHIMLGVRGVPVDNDGEHYFPVETHGVKLMSLGLVLEEESPVVWRGPLAAKTLEDLFRLTEWGVLDYLVVDLPPGTGDVQITLAQSFPLTSGVIVTTPQDVAAADAGRALSLFEKTGVPVLGIVENMAAFRCPDCGALHRIFGQGGARSLAERHGLDVLAELPLDPRIASEGDAGAPSALARDDSEALKAFAALSRGISARLALLPKDYSGRIPRVVKG